MPISIGLGNTAPTCAREMALGGGLIEGLNIRAGYSDYTHTEFEGDEMGTVFAVDGLESRVELVQAKRGSWRGQVGGQYYFRDFRATGVEAYIPPNLTDQWAVFALQEVAAGPVADRSWRGDTSGPTSRPAAPGSNAASAPASGALSVAHETAKGLRFGANLSRVARAPSAEELLADGAHIATQAYEIGNRDLGLERAWGVEAFVRGKVGPGTLSLAAYRNRFSGYIYQEETGAEIDGLPVLQTVQRAATYSGLEGEFSYPVVDSGPFTLLAEVRGDYVRASLKNGTPLPRIPPMSLLGALEARTDRFDVRGEVQWTSAQDRVAPNETPDRRVRLRQRLDRVEAAARTTTR